MSTQTLDTSAANSESFTKRASDLGSFKRELNALTELRQAPRIIKLISSDDSQRTLTVARAPGRNLSDILRFEDIDTSEAKTIILQVSIVLAYMHSRPDGAYAHYDLKPANIIYDRENMDVSVIDFGTSFPVNNAPESFKNHVVGTPIYNAPEKLRFQPELARESDIYALGAIWFELINGAPPFDPSIGNLNNQIFNSDVPEIKTDCADTKQLILSMLSKDPMKRPDIGVVINQLNIQDMTITDDNSVTGVLPQAF